MIIGGVCSRLIDTLRAIFLVVALCVELLTVIAGILPIVIAVLIALALTAHASTVSRAGLNAFAGNDFAIF